eukprot:COSAG02_NODE_2926_length_7728_cov_3.194521_7_plen_37_part_00
MRVNSVLQGWSKTLFMVTYDDFGGDLSELIHCICRH